MSPGGTESSYDPLQDETMKISIPKTMRMDDMLENLGTERKTRFAGYLVDYIENNLDRYANLPGKKPALFDKSRENDQNRALKFSLIRRFNEKPHRFPNQDFNDEFDLGIACDLLLDLFRYENQEIINPAIIVQDFKQMQKKGQMYGSKDFFKRVKNHFFVLIFKSVFKLIEKAAELKQFKSCSQVALNLADALITEDHQDQKMELSKVLRNMLRVMTGAIEDSTMGLSSHRSSHTLAQMHAAYNKNGGAVGTNTAGRTSSIRSRRSGSPNDRPAIPDISDDMRVQMARDLSQQLNSDLKLPNFTAYSDAAKILNQLKSQQLIVLAN